MVQLREKDLEARALLHLAQELSPLLQAHRAKWLINDRVDLVLALNASGVHLRSNSLPVPIVRRLLGPDRLIGLSTHSSAEVREAESQQVDFVLVGPIYDTPSKRMYGRPLGVQTLKTICQAARIPIYAIGGITPERVPEVLDAGAYGVAVISSILQADAIQETTQKFLDLLP
jgi:thiamine-phosphate pyrophosphorylase